MTDPRFTYSFQQLGRGPGQPPGLLGRIASAVIMGALAVGALMFSAVLFAALLAVGLGVWAWLWWKTRELRKTMREGAARAREASPDFGAGRGATGSTTVIEGEVIREVHDEADLHGQR